jgi:endonuclease/exonuclease/phosphatase (EEP) superfamily protein YafD
VTPTTPTRTEEDAAEPPQSDARSSAPLARRSLIRRLLTGACWAAVVCVALAVVFAWSMPVPRARVAAPFEFLYAAAFVIRTLATHAALATAALLLVCLACSAFKPALLAAIFTAFLANHAVRDLIPASPQPASAGTDTLTVYSANIYKGRADIAALRASIDQHNPDVVVLQEATPGFLVRAEQAGLFDGYPHTVFDPRDHAFGQATLSKRPFTREPELIETVSATATWGPWDIVDPQRVIAVPFAGGELTIVNIHLTNPMAPRRIVRQALQTRALVEWFESHQQTHESDRREYPSAPFRGTLVLGDFNCTPHAAHAAMIRDAGLRDAHRLAGSGLGETHPGSRRLAPYTFGFRIDHAYLCDALDATRFETVATDIGSDHQPIVVTITPRR